jgi:hypothetical protein
MDRTRTVGIQMRALKLDAAGISAALDRTLLDASSGCAQSQELGRLAAGVPRMLDDTALAGIMDALPCSAEAAALRGIMCGAS